MQVSVDDLWKLLAASELPCAARVDALRAEFDASAATAAEPVSVRRLLHWLVAGGHLTRYQAAVLAAGRPGPFVFGSFVILGRIDTGRLRGLFQATYKGRQPVLLAPQTKGDSSPDEWIRLAESSAAVTHPHIARVYRVVRHKAQSFAVLETLAGQSLAERLAGGPLTTEQAVAIGRQVASALTALAAANQAHGAIAPANIWLDTDGTARLLPFPLIPLAERQQASPHGDLQGLGATLHELLQGHNAGENLRALIDELAEAPSEAASLSAGDIVRRLENMRAAPMPAVKPVPTIKVAAPVAVAIPLPDDREQGPAPLVFVEPREAAVISPRRKPKGRSLSVALAAGVALFAVVGYLVYQRQTAYPVAAHTSPATQTAIAPSAAAPGDATQAPTVEHAEPAAPIQSSGATKSSAASETTIADDSKSLWESPTAGEPLELKYLPGGAQLIFALRPAELLATDEGSKLFDALGPGGAWARESLEAMLGVPLTDAETLTLAFVPDESLAPRPVAVMQWVRSLSNEELTKAWNNPRPVKHAEQEYLLGTQWAYYLPAAEAGRVAVIGPEAMIKEVIDLAGQPNLPKGIERLVRRSDRARQFTLMFTPSFLLADGRDLLTGGLEKLRPTISEFFDQQIDAVLLSAHVGNELYVEFRAAAPASKRPPVLAEELRTQWNAAPEQVESHLAGQSIAPHGRMVVNRLPRMLQLARDYTRTGIDDDQVVLNSYLPSTATHNLLLGAELALAGLTESGANSKTATNTPAAAPAHAADLLQRKISLSFPRESLDRCLDVLSKELGLEIVILGADLQLEGITKNQSLNNVDEREQPAEAILRKILLLANPDGKLAYVIRPGKSTAAGPTAETLFITTREAAKKRGEPLPPGF